MKHIPFYSNFSTKKTDSVAIENNLLVFCEEDRQLRECDFARLVMKRVVFAILRRNKRIKEWMLTFIRCKALLAKEVKLLMRIIP